jgi:DNA processing protein
MVSRSRYTPPADVRILSAEDAFEDVLPAELMRLPPILYCAGDTTLLRAPALVAIVGSRSASADGVRRSAKLARQLAQAGVATVSGLAKGIDFAAHAATLQAGGRTIAVIGTPLDTAYPAAHAELQAEIYRHHLLISQFTPGSRVFPSNFVARNRVMARIAHASVIVEAGDGSGSLSQAREVLSLGRPLFLMRSLLDNRDLKWPESFVKNGARILDNTDEVLEAIR